MCFASLKKEMLEAIEIYGKNDLYNIVDHFVSLLGELKDIEEEYYLLKKEFEKCKKRAEMIKNEFSGVHKYK